jgi:hypothetical protein
MALDIIGFFSVLKSALTVALLVLWIGLAKPESPAQFWSRFKEQLLGIKKQSQFNDRSD